ncbi:MAG: hypothetical protein NTV88_02220 [Candidatus Micrarchaeota archaeon]|nr:hypothetical protein [Candidatus Micrarchaeota archaeon]
MKVYPDANIYITYLLGQRGEALADRFFKQGIGCRFSIVASNTMFAEVAQRCKGSGVMLLQKNIDDYKKVGKLEVHIMENAEIDEAEKLDLASGCTYGQNDMEHSLIARKLADAFITDDKRLAKYLRKEFGQTVFLLEEFVNSKP